MAVPSEDVLTKVSTEAAEDFIDAYYTALDGSRTTISSYYMPQQTLPDGRIIPVIVYNGNVLANAAAFQQMFENNMPFTHYEVQSVNSHIMNPTFSSADLQKQTPDQERSEKNMSVLVQVSGYVRLEERKEGPMKGFSETIVLVPNVAAMGKGKGKGSEQRSWLIQSQNFRYVV
ncbi:hypothetical protein B0A49_00900 [Cryomyces minteri]|uniref:NTF2 domain-containing protein n=1 Tax=Cryomyces minteri TaxID=331657 RepID=A0A4U0XL96_9PEZI|nr:hypothetical protein B0A49_01664 [Cryomyces minteri]TKA79807.1 hypothetical protein B0A49_00900 [Cryomyces minteri]